MYFYGRRLIVYTTQLSPLQINNTTFEIVHNVKNLGVIFKNVLNWSNHINAICGEYA